MLKVNASGHVPAARWGHTFTPVLDESKMFLFGGTGLKLYNDLLSFDPIFLVDPTIHFVLLETFQWRREEALGRVPSSRFGHTANCLSSGDLIFFGGSKGNGKFVNDIWRLHPASMRWEKVHFDKKSEKPEPRCSHTSVHLSSDERERIIVFGGYGKKYYNNAYELDLDTMLWKAIDIQGPKPPARGGHVSFAKGKHMFIFGGSDGKGGYYNDLWVLNTETWKWSELQCGGVLPSKRTGHAVIFKENQAYIVGGENNNKFLNDIHVLDLESMRWTQHTIFGTPFSPRFKHSSSYIKNKLLIFGGSGPGELLNDMYIMGDDLEYLSKSKEEDAEIEVGGDLSQPMEIDLDRELEKEALNLEARKDLGSVKREIDETQIEQSKIPKVSSSFVYSKEGIVEQDLIEHNAAKLLDVERAKYEVLIKDKRQLKEQLQQLDHKYRESCKSFAAQIAELDEQLKKTSMMHEEIRTSLMQERQRSNSLQEALKTVQTHLDNSQLLNNSLKEQLVSAVNESRVFSLCHSASKGDLEAIKSLVEAGENVNSCDYDKRTPLHLASCEGHLEVVKYLESMGAQLHAKDRWGSTPLQDALRYGHSDVADFLCKDTSRAVTSLELDEDKLPDLMNQIAFGDQDYCCLRFGNNRNHLHGTFKLIIQEICGKFGWDYGELWVPNHSGYLECCKESYFMKTLSLERFRRLSTALLYEANSECIGEVFGSRVPSFYENVSNLLQMNFYRSPLAKITGLKTCIGVPVLCDEQAMGVLALFSVEQKREEKQIVATLMEISSITAKVVASFALVNNNKLGLKEYSDVIQRLIESDGYGDFNLLAALKGEGFKQLFAPVVKASEGMESEQHRPIINLLAALALNAPTLEAIRDPLISALKYFVSVSPEPGPKTPVVRLATEALQKLQQYGYIGIFWYNHIDRAVSTGNTIGSFYGKGLLESPVMQQIRQHQSQAIEFFENWNRKDELLTKYKKDWIPELSVRDIYSTLGISFHAQTGYGNTNNGSSQVKRVADAIRSIMGCVDNLITIEQIKFLHSQLDLEIDVAKGEYRETSAVGSWQFFTTYRVFLPWEEIPKAMAEFEQFMNTDTMKQKHPALQSFLAYTTLVYFIHPFSDGNGRVGRLLANMLLRKGGYPAILDSNDKVLTFSEYLQRILNVGQAITNCMQAFSVDRI